MSVGVALKVAALLDLRPEEPVFSSLYHQAATNEEREFWQQVHLVYCGERD